MELAGALEVTTRARWRSSSAWHPTTSQPTATTVLDLRNPLCASTHHRSRSFQSRIVGKFHNNGGVCCSASPPLFSTNNGGLMLRRREPLSRFRAWEQAAADVEVEVVGEDEEGPRPDREVEKEEGGGKGEEGENEVAASDVKSYEEDFGIDEDGNLTASLPPEFVELMKDEGPAPNYWLAGFGLTMAYLARKAIWKEIKLWGKLALASGRASWQSMGLLVVLFKKLIIMGGEPLKTVLVSIAFVVRAIHNFFRFIVDLAPPLPIMYAITLASIVLLVGESVSDTYSSSEKQFPSRTILDTAALLGLGGFVGVLPVEITLLGIAAITVYLLFVRKVNPVAGLTPAAAVFAAVAEPIIRYPVLFSFVGFSTYRYWKLGYLSSGAVHKERTSEYPRILIALLYLVGVSCAARVFFFTFDSARILFTALN
ncbi:unnamed protein product [Calypogeia fissa]